MTEAIIPIILGVVSTAASVYSTVESSQAETRAEHQVERQQKRAAEAARSAAALRASDEEKRHRQILAGQRARYGASGLETEGTPLLVEMESLKESEEQLRRIREGGEVQYMTGMELAKAAGQRAQAAQTSGYVSAVGKAAGGTYTLGEKRDWWV